MASWRRQVDLGAISIELPPEPSRRPVPGLLLRPAEGGLLVRWVLPGGPAAGPVRQGDLLVSADGRPVAGLEGGAARAAVVGPAGRARSHRFLRDGDTVLLRLASVRRAELAGRGAGGIVRQEKEQR